jgi:hypothetical protein
LTTRVGSRLLNISKLIGVFSVSKKIKKEVLINKIYYYFDNNKTNMANG